MSSTPADERSQAAAVAAHESWATTTDRTARTSPAREGLRRKFLDQADGDPVRAEHLWKAHLARMRLKSMQARRRAKEQAERADAAQAELDSLGAGDSE